MPIDDLCRLLKEINQSVDDEDDDSAAVNIVKNYDLQGSYYVICI